MLKFDVKSISLDSTIPNSQGILCIREHIHLELLAFSNHFLTTDWKAKIEIELL